MKTKADTQEVVEALEEAQGKLFEVIESLEWVARITHNRYAEAYLIDHLKIMASSDHGFISCDFNLDEWIAKAREDEIDE